MEDFKELINAAKDEAARKRWYVEYQNAVDDCERGVRNGGCNLGNFQLVTDKAMEIVAKNAYNQAIRDAANLSSPSEYVECGFLHVEKEAILKLLK